MSSQKKILYLLNQIFHFKLDYNIGYILEKEFNSITPNFHLMFSYTFDNGKWVESNKLYLHDIALLLDPNEKKIYYWEGPKSTTQMKQAALPCADEMKKKFPKFEFDILGKVYPLKIEKEIEEKLDHSFESSVKIDRSPDYILFVILTFISFAVMFVSYIFILRPISWGFTSTLPGYNIVSQFDFADWVGDTRDFLLVVIILFGVLLVDSIITKKIFLITTAAVCLLVQFGTYQYISLGIFLFDFQTVSEPIAYHYYILTSEVNLFTFLNIIGLVACLIPLLISINAIRKDTVKISFAEWNEKRKQSKLVMPKYSIFKKQVKLVPIEPPTSDQSKNMNET